jgi:DNA-binding beta-propeller fold protein YncE
VSIRLFLACAVARASLAAAAEPAAAETHRVVKDGAVVEFTLERAEGAADVARPLMEGEYANVKFRMTDAASGKPVAGAKPAAWIDIGRALEDGRSDQKTCKDKIGLYLKGIVGMRPMIDLNSYFLLVMNRDPSISVIDPLVSMTGKTSLYASVILRRPPADWAKSADQKRLWVSMPKADEVAVIDTDTFKLSTTVAAGKEPTRVAVQPDGRYVWVGDDARGAADSGVSVIDAQAMKRVAHLATGRGHHEIAFSTDDRWAFVSNRDEGTVSVIDVAKLAKAKDLRTGPLPISVAFSPLSQALYVADGKEGTVSVVDAATLEVKARLAAKPGLGPMRFSRDGRWGFVVNPSEHAAFVVDAAEGQIAHRVPLDGQPYQITFSRAFAYLRLIDSEKVDMVNLLSLGKGKRPIVQSFAAGQVAPQAVADLGLADGISPASNEAAVFVVNPADSNTYFYMEGMNAPMGSFAGYGHPARGVTVVDRSLKEVEPGVYAGKVRLPEAGRYDVAFLLDSPRVLHCFSAEAAKNPLLRNQLGGIAIEYLDFPSTAAVGQPLKVRFRLTDPGANAPKTGVRDVRVRWFVPPGDERGEAYAREVEKGMYEASALLAREGAYYVHVVSRSLKVGAGGLPFRTVRATAASAPVRPEPGEAESRGETPPATVTATVSP